MFTHIALLCALVGSPTTGVASLPKSASSSNAAVAVSKGLDSALAPVEKDVVSLAEAMPADRYDFVPTQDLFRTGVDVNYKGVRSFGQQIAHLIQINNLLFLGVAGIEKPDSAFNSRNIAVGKMTSKDELLRALKSSFANAHSAIATLTPENAWQHAGRNPDYTRAEEVTHAISHARDIYGQLVVYLRMNGIVPPASEGQPLAIPRKAK